MVRNDAGELDAIAAELYVLAPAEFTAARNARASAASGSLATQVKALRKPTVSAWAVNLLARDGQLGEAVELSHALREAQDDLDAPELARLGAQRRALVAGLARRAAQLAESAGTTLSATAQEDVVKTVNAAVVDPGAAAAVLTGRLVRPVEAAGTDDAELADHVGGSVPGIAAAPPARSRDDLAARRARKAAEAAAREAQRAAAEAARELQQTADRLAKRRERAELLHERVDDLRAELSRLTDDAAKADAEVATLEQERARREKRSEEAAAHAARAQEAVEAGDAG
ncbi:transposase [Microbacterium sp. P04]|uniref:transposase n=1 Tax=Microbacterium sp. P04 TaxID=3366947 RepID=UPI00374711A3